MKKKIFFITIPMQPPESLKKLRYRKEDKGTIYSEPTAFPGIAMLDGSVLEINDEIKIITVRTDDDNERTKANYDCFKAELQELSGRIGRTLNIDSEILLPHSENREKQLSLMKNICSYFDKDSDIYMDITYGTKVTPIGMFSSLVYAEKVKGCTIKSIIYGKYNHDNQNDIGDLYDVRILYEMAMLISSAEILTQEKLTALLDELWG